MELFYDRMYLLVNLVVTVIKNQSANGKTKDKNILPPFLSHSGNSLAFCSNLYIGRSYVRQSMVET